MAFLIVIFSFPQESLFFCVAMKAGWTKLAKYQRLTRLATFIQACTTYKLDLNNNKDIPM